MVKIVVRRELNLILNLQPKIRYTDTSYIIFQQWQKGGGKATFPIVYNFVPHPKLPQNEIENNKSSKLADNTVQQNGSIASKPNGDVIQKANGSIPQKPEPINGKKLKKRRSRSLDRKRNKRSLIIDDSDESLYDGDDDIDVVDNVRCSSVPITSNVTVDVHRPNSTILQVGSTTTQQDVNALKTSPVVPDNVKCDGTLDINHNALPLTVFDNVDSDTSKEVANWVEIRRKKFNPISDSSSFDESSNQEAGYATVQRENLKSLRSNIPLRQRLNAQMKNRILKRGVAPTTLSVGPGGRLKRGNSFRNIGTMQADLVGNGKLRRSNSALNLAARLGVRGQVGGANSRRRLIRNNVATQRSRSRSRSRSRQNLVRSNSQTNLRRTNSKQSLATLKRSNSQVSGRSASRQRPRLLQRSNSRNNLNIRNRNNANGNRRIGSINGRLGVKQVGQTRNVQRGRIIKRRNSNVNGKNGNVGAIGRNGARQRVARSRTRVAQTNPRNRSASRGRNGRQQNANTNFNRNNQQNRSRQSGRGRGGRSRSRGRPGRPAAGANKQPKQKKSWTKSWISIW